MDSPEIGSALHLAGGAVHVHRHAGVEAAEEVAVAVVGAAEAGVLAVGHAGAREGRLVLVRDVGDADLAEASC